MRIEIPRPSKPVDGMQFNNETGFDLLCMGEKLYVEGNATEAELQAAYDAHIVKVPTPEEKLFAKTGLTVEEYKALEL